MKRWAALLVGILATAPSAFSDQPLTDRQLEDSLKQLDDWKDSVKEQAKSVSNTFRAILRDEDRLKSRRKLFECQMKYGWLFDDVTPIENRAKGAKEPGKGPRLSEKELRNTFKVLQDNGSQSLCGEDRYGEGYDGRAFTDDLIVRSKVFSTYKRSSLERRFGQLGEEYMEIGQKWISVADKIDAIIANVNAAKGYYIKPLIPGTVSEFNRYRSFAYSMAWRDLEKLDELTTNAYDKKLRAPDGYDLEGGYHIRVLKGFDAERLFVSGQNGSEEFLSSIEEGDEPHFFDWELNDEVRLANVALQTQVDGRELFVRINIDEAWLEDVFSEDHQSEARKYDFSHEDANYKPLLDGVLTALEKSELELKFAQGERSEIRSKIREQKAKRRSWEGRLKGYKNSAKKAKVAPDLGVCEYYDGQMGACDDSIKVLQGHLNNSTMDTTGFVYNSTYRPGNNHGGSIATRSGQEVSSRASATTSDRMPSDQTNKARVDPYAAEQAKWEAKRKNSNPQPQWKVYTYHPEKPKTVVQETREVTSSEIHREGTPAAKMTTSSVKPNARTMTQDEYVRAMEQRYQEQFSQNSEPESDAKLEKREMTARQKSGRVLHLSDQEKSKRVEELLESEGLVRVKDANGEVRYRSVRTSSESDVSNAPAVAPTVMPQRTQKAMKSAITGKTRTGQSTTTRGPSED